MTPDQPYTIALALVGTILVLVLPLRWALAPLAISLCIYPSTLVLPPENLQFTAQRLIGLALFIRCLSTREVRGRFKWSMIDTVAVVYFAMLAIAQVLAGINVDQAIFNRGGFFLSAMVPYFCTRMLITDRESLYALLKGWVWVSVALAIFGVFQMQTGVDPFGYLQRFGLLKADPSRPTVDQRIFMGQMTFRAHGPFVQCIMFGWFFALLMAPTTNLFWEKRKAMPWGIAWLALPVGLVSSIAGGPMLLAGLSLSLLSMFPLRGYWKGFLIFVAVMYVGVLLGSNREPMAILADNAFDQSSSWYRLQLRDFAMRNMGGHWFGGYGTVPPVFEKFHDLCIQWVSLLVVNGLLGVVAFYGFVAAGAWTLWKARRRATSLPDQWLLWALMSTLVGSLIGMAVVALFAEMNYIYHMFLAIVGCSPWLVGGSERHVGLLAQVEGKTVVLRYALRPGQKLAIFHPPAGGAASS